MKIFYTIIKCKYFFNNNLKRKCNCDNYINIGNKLHEFESKKKYNFFIILKLE